MIMVTDINNDIQLILISGYNKTFWNINFLVLTCGQNLIVGNATNVSVNGPLKWVDDVRIRGNVMQSNEETGYY